jgi:hypothetical protein
VSAITNAAIEKAAIAVNTNNAKFLNSLSMILTPEISFALFMR